MKAWLVLQEGPGAGYSYPLDPFQKPMLSVGRSSECDIALDDHRASRHHSDIRWNGRQWEVVDRGSTNGTYVNGMRVHRPYDLRLGDRVTIGETTLVLRDTAPGARPAAPTQPRAAREMGRTAEGPAIQGSPPVARPIQRPSQPIPHERVSPAVMVAFWLVQGLIMIAVVCLASGAFLPWLRVTGTLSEDLGSMLQGITDIVSYFLGTDSFFHFTQDISGLEGYGKLTLGLAVVGLIGLIVDIFFYRKSAVAGILYVLASLIVIGAMASDLINFYQFYKEAESWGLLFGIQLGDVIQVFDRFISVQITPLPGLPLTVAGLVLLLVGGIGRLIVALLSRNRSM
jgi:hypothetical protein